MSHLKLFADRLDAFNESGGVKYQMLRKGIDLILLGKTSNEAWSFVETLHKDGRFTRDKAVYSESQLMSFGNYLLSEGRENKIKGMDPNGNEAPLARVVHYADVKHWLSPIEYAPETDNSKDGSGVSSKEKIKSDTELANGMDGGGTTLSNASVGIGTGSAPEDDEQIEDVINKKV